MSIFTSGFRDYVKDLYSEDVLESIINNLETYSEQFEINPIISFGSGEEYNLPQAYQLFISAQKQDGKMSESSERQYRMCLERMLKEIKLPLNKITVNHLRMHIDSISVNQRTGKPLSRAALNQRKSIIRSFFAFCEEEGFVEKNPALRIKRSRDDAKPREAFTDVEVEMVRNSTLFSEKHSDALCKRTTAIVDLFVSSGIRVSELCSLNINDIDFARREFMVYGKGSKWRRCYMDARAVISIKAYLETRSDDNKALFVTVKKPIERIAPCTVGKSIRIFSDPSGIKEVYPHRYRHTLATVAINRGMDAATLQKILGHTRIETTMRYAHISDESVKASYVAHVK